MYEAPPGVPRRPGTTHFLERSSRVVHEDAQQRPGSAVCLLDALPELSGAVPHDDLPLARRALTVPTTLVPAGSSWWEVPQAARSPFGWVVVDGLVLRRTRLEDRCAAEVLGAGDVVTMDAGDDDDSSMPTTIEHVAHRDTTVAVLDDRFRVAARRWPHLHDVLHGQLAGQVRRASRNLAILHLSRVDDRLLSAFRDLADRWGHVTVDGIVLDLDLTHTLLGELVGARRPTVTLALTELAAAGSVMRRVDRTWLLRSEAAGLVPAA